VHEVVIKNFRSRSLCILYKHLMIEYVPYLHKSIHSVFIIPFNSLLPAMRLWFMNYTFDLKQLLSKMCGIMWCGTASFVFRISVCDSSTKINRQCRKGSEGKLHIDSFCKYLGRLIFISICEWESVNYESGLGFKRRSFHLSVFLCFIWYVDWHT